MLLSLGLLLHGRIRVAVGGSTISFVSSVCRQNGWVSGFRTLGRRRVALGRNRVSPAVSDGRVNVGLAHGISGAGGRAAVLHGTSVATTAVATVAATSEASSARAVVGSLVNSNRSAVKPAGAEKHV